MTQDLSGALTAGTIVSFHFPERGPEAAAPKARPCLVIATAPGPEGPRLTLAYGTSADTPANRGLDLTLADPAEWRAAGLHRATRFVLARRLTVPEGDPRLIRKRAGTAALGRLPAARLPQLARLAALLGPALRSDDLGGRPPGKPAAIIERRGSRLPRRALPRRGQILQMPGIAGQRPAASGIKAAGEARTGGGCPSSHCHQP